MPHLETLSGFRASTDDRINEASCGSSSATGDPSVRIYQLVVVPGIMMYYSASILIRWRRWWLPVWLSRLALQVTPRQKRGWEL